jgi:hypothetical protein
MLKKYGDPRFIGAALGSATGGVPQNDPRLCLEAACFHFVNILALRPIILGHDRRTNDESHPFQENGLPGRCKFKICM